MLNRIVPAAALLVLVAAASPAAGGPGVPFNLSGAFNSEFWVSPTTQSICIAAKTNPNNLYADPGYAFDLAGELQVVNAQYPLGSGNTATPSGGNGVGAFPANGTMASLTDSRTYYLASLTGNSLYPGDQIEIANQNAILIGQGYNDSWSVPAVNMAVTPGHYADINLVLAAGSGGYTPDVAGAAYIQIWAVYSAGNAALLYDFGGPADPYGNDTYYQGPAFQTASNTDSDFQAVYTAKWETYDYFTGGFAEMGTGWTPLNLYEFVTPRTLDGGRILTGLKFVDTAAGGGYGSTPADVYFKVRELAILAATATAATTSNVTLTMSVGPAGAGTVTPSGGSVPGDSTQAVTATANSGYVFDHWTASDTAVFIANSLSASTTVTLGTNNCTVTGIFRSTSGYSGSETATGGTIQLTSSGPYYYGQVVGLTASASAGWQFTSWSATGATVWSATATTTSLTVLNSFTLAALFTEIPYTVTTSAAPLAGGTVSYLPAGTQYINNVLAITALPSPGYQFVSWTVSGAALGANVASTTATVNNNVSLTASFALIPYTVTVNQVAGGTVTVSPSQTTYYYGNTATVTATTSGGYGFASWNVTGGTVSPLTSSVATLTVQGNVTLSANIGTGATLTVTTARGTVTVTPSQATYPYGTTVTITTSTVNTGYVLDHWTLSGVGTLSNSGALTTTLTLNSNSNTLTAVYVTGSYVNNLNPLASDSNVGSLARPFKTINKATSTARAGSTIVVLQGVYREQPTLGNNGTAGSPITLRSNSGDRVVIDAAGVIPSGSGSWTQCTSATASGNPNYANIYYTDIPWNPVGLGEGNPAVVFEDETPLAWGQAPALGWWVVTGGTSTTLTDTVNLTQTDANYWVGSNVFLWDTGYTVQGLAAITGYNPATHTITVNNFSSISTGYATSAGDWYVVDGCIHALTGSGQVAVNPSPRGGGYYRVFVWPLGGGRPDGHLFEADTYQNFWIDIANASYWVFSGLEVCNNQGNAFGGWDTGGHLTIQNSVIHDNGNAFYLGNTYPYCQFVNNYVTLNGNGFDIGTLCPNALVQGNEISWNGVHGINLCSSSSSLMGNYIHDHIMWGHTDNIQLFNSESGSVSGLTNILIQDNLVVNASQDIMMSDLNGVTTFRGNDFYCSFAYMMQSYPNDYNFDFEHNTIMCAGYGAVALDNMLGNVRFYNNLYYDNGSEPYGNIPSSQLAVYTADYNLFYGSLTGTTGACFSINWNSYTFPQYVASTSQDTHGMAANPRFANMAPIFIPGGFGAYGDFSPNHFYGLNGIPSQVAIGDYLCIDRDGVARQVTAINTTNGYVTFTPSAAKFAFKYGTAFDWQTNTNFNIDLTLQAGSPAIGAASDGGNIGSAINVPSYETGNFGAYGSRPTWPLTPANVMQWAVAATHSGGVGDLAVTTSEGQVEPRSKAGKFQISFDSALSAATISSSAVTGVTIVSSTGSNYSSRIASAALDATGQVLTVTLSSPLPDQQWYIIALNPAITAANGGPVRGVKSVKVGMLAGNVTGSRAVTAADAAAERNYIGVPVTAATARYDVDGNGVITAADQRLVQSLVGHSLP